MFDKLHITVSTHNGLQLSAECKRGDRWHYVGGGVSQHRVDLVYGSAAKGEVSDALTRMARVNGEEPARYAAANRGHQRQIVEFEP